MTPTHKNRPSVETEAVQNQAGELTPILQHTPAILPMQGGPFAHFPDRDIDLRALTEGSTNPRYEVYLAGWARGRESRQAEVDALNYTADRLYAEMCRRTPPKAHDLTSYADLEATRADIYAGAR